MRRSFRITDLKTSIAQSMDRDFLGGLALWVDLNHSRRLGHVFIIVLHSDPVLTCTHVRSETYDITNDG